MHFGDPWAFQAPDHTRFIQHLRVLTVRTLNFNSYLFAGLRVNSQENLPERAATDAPGYYVPARDPDVTRLHLQ